MILVEHYFGNMRGFRLSSRFPLYKKKMFGYKPIDRSEVNSWNPRKEEYQPGSFDKSIVEGVYLLKETSQGKRFLRLSIEGGNVIIDDIFMPITRGNKR